MGNWYARDIVSGSDWKAQDITSLPATGGEIKAWTGAAWEMKPVKYWTGSAWEIKPLKRWTGSAWELT